MKKQKIFALSTLFLLCAHTSLYSATYKIDPVHSVICFKIEHLMISKVWGRFNAYSGEIVYGKDTKQENWKCSAIIDVKSIDTGNSMRDEHLRGNEFFNVEKFPQAMFVSTKITGLKEKNNLQYGKLIGNLTLMGVTRSIVLTGKLTGLGKGMKGEKRVGFEAKTTIDRRDFGMNWNQKLDDGNRVVGNQVDIFIQLEAVQE